MGSTITFYSNHVVKSIHTQSQEGMKEIEYLFLFNTSGNLDRKIVLINQDTISDNRFSL